MYFHIIASGSKGNATVVVSNKTVLLVDMGITLTRLEEGLAEINLTKKDITGALFTHNHTDHISGIKFLSPKIMYALEGTLPSSLSNKVAINQPFVIGDFTITPIETSHDALNPCAYLIKDKDIFFPIRILYMALNAPLFPIPPCAASVTAALMASAFHSPASSFPFSVLK